MLPQPRQRKKAANLSIDTRLLDEAKRLKLNLSQVLESALADVVRQHQSMQWLEKNRAALEAYNDHVEHHGVFSDGLRSF